MKLITQRDDTAIVDHLTSTIVARIEADESVLWLVPGGSAMKVAAKTLENLQDYDTSRLCITLTDERYGRPGHEDENWTQLERLGFVVQSINAYRVLRGEDVETTAQDFSDKLSRLFDTFSYKIGLFGVGSDGHTAGIKPHSSAVASDEYAAQFEGEDFTRVTITPKAIEMLDEAVVYAHGVDKHEVLRQMLYEDVALEVQPAQILKAVPRSTIFSDFAG